jgi:hypothetical protein
MVENQAGSNDLLDTTDCLEAVGVFKGWKNLLFLILVVGLLLLQAGFFLVDQGYVEIDGQAYVDEPEADPGESIAPDEPAKSVEPNTPAGPEPDGAPVAGSPEEANEPAEPNVSYRQPGPTKEAELQLAALPFLDFLSKITWAQLSWTVNLVNAVLILTATLYCLTLLFSLKVSMHGRLGGINHITRAFFLSLLMLVLLLPWQKVFGSVVTGAVFTPDEIVKWYSAKGEDLLDVILYYMRFSGYGLLMLLLVILSQIRSLRWAKAILRRLEII